jgi:hypothetical protein
MQQGFGASALVPLGFAVESAVFGDASTLITIRHASKVGACPRCGRISERVHSQYHRHLLDLPVAGRSVRLIVVARRFRCDAVLCGQRIFTERFDKDVLAPWARQSRAVFPPPSECMWRSWHVQSVAGGRNTISVGAASAAAYPCGLVDTGFGPWLTTVKNS